GSANFLPARARRHADFSKLALPWRRAELVGCAPYQPQLQFSAQLEDAVVRPLLRGSPSGVLACPIAVLAQAATRSGRAQGDARVQRRGHGLINFRIYEL